MFFKRINKVLWNLFLSQILRQDKAPLDKSALPDDEREKLDDFLDQMKENNRTTSTINSKDHQNNGIDTVPIRSKPIVVSYIHTYLSQSLGLICLFFLKNKSNNPTPSAPVINNNGKPKRTVPRSYEEWGK